MSESASFSKRYSLLVLLLAFSCSARQDGAPEVAEKGQAPSAEPTHPVPLSDSPENYSIVLKPEVGFVAVGRKGEELYQVFLYDNGPDYPSDGYFR
ncbi:MAG: hypothetical protein J5I94_26500, partial [Phaeodactylibacter sp.]|nr:hypothetical protein [Phaeodactylibacter sp.]